MSVTPRLGLPYIATGQAQKETTYGDAMNIIDAMVQATVINMTTTAPPGSPVEGDAYVIAPVATGAWAGKEGQIASYYSDWTYQVPVTGWSIYDVAMAGRYQWSGSAWVAFNAPASTTEALTGTNATKFITADALAALWEKGSGVASAATISLGEGGLFHITGTTTITDIDFTTPKDGRMAVLIFDGALTLTHNGTTLICPGAADITTAAGDRAIIMQDSGDNIVVVDFIRANTVPYTVESGIWSPIPDFSTPGDSSVASYTNQTGRYRKFGKQVYIDFDVWWTWNAYTTASGAFRITGLPFAGNSASPFKTFMPTGMASATVTADQVAGYLFGGNSYLTLRGETFGGSNTTLTTTSFPASGTFRLSGSLTYLTT